MSIELTPEQAKALVDHVWTTLHHRSKDDSAAAVAAVREVERQLWARDEEPKPTHRFKRATHRTGQYTWNGSIEVRYQRRLNGERSTVQKAVEIEIEKNDES